MDTTADGLDELSELRRRCAALQAENSELQMRLERSATGVPAVWAAFAADVRPRNALTPAQVMECGRLFCQYLDGVNALHIRVNGLQHELAESANAMRIFAGDERTVCAFARHSLGEEGCNFLVEGDLELLLEQTSRALGFSLSHSIMREPHLLPLDCREGALAFVMLTHPRLGQNSGLSALPEELVRRVVGVTWGQPWSIFRGDVYFKDFLDLVARHVNAAHNGEKADTRDWILARCSACNKWRRLPDGFALGPEIHCQEINRACHQAENVHEDKDERWWRRRWWKRFPWRHNEWKEEEEEERGVLVSRAEEPVRIQHLLKRLILGANLGTVTLEMCENHIKSLFDDGDAVCIGHETLIQSTFEQLNAQRMVGKIMAEQVPDSAPVCPVVLLQLARQLHQLAMESVAAEEDVFGTEEPIRVSSEEEDLRSLLLQLMATPVLVACADLVNKGLKALLIHICEEHIRVSFDDDVWHQVCIEHKQLIESTIDAWIQEARRAQRARAQPTFFEVAPVSLQKCVSNEAIRRLMRRAGVTRCSINAYTAVRQILSDYLETLVSVAMLHVEHRCENVVTSSDVELAVQQHFGRRLYVATREEHLERFETFEGVGAYEHVRSMHFICEDRELYSLPAYQTERQLFQLQEVRYAQRSTNLMIRSRPFQHLVETLGRQNCAFIEFDPCAVQALQEAVEDYVVHLIEDAHLHALSGGRAVLVPNDFQLARRVRGERA